MAHSKKSKRARVATVVDRLAKEYPDATTALDHLDAFELLVATILSAQCTDERVNRVTKVLFARAPDAARLHAMPIEEVETIIRSTGFFRNKAKSLKGTAKMLVEEFGGRVPDRMEDLLRLRGVARKTANVVLGSAFGKAVGVVVDTHVRRVSGRLGLTEHQQPEKIEADLMDLVPKQEWISFSHRLVWHGRRVCKARKPHCDDCVLADLCPSQG